MSANTVKKYKVIHWNINIEVHSCSSHYWNVVLCMYYGWKKAEWNTWGEDRIDSRELGFVCSAQVLCGLDQQALQHQHTHHGWDGSCCVLTECPSQSSHSAHPTSKGVQDPTNWALQRVCMHNETQLGWVTRLWTFTCECHLPLPLHSSLHKGTEDDQLFLIQIYDVSWFCEQHFLYNHAYSKT